MSSASIPDDLLEALRTKLSTAVVSDVLDAMGHRRQVLPPTIRPLAPEMKVVGRAMTVQVADSLLDETQGAHGPLAKLPFGLMVEAVDSLQAGEVCIATGASQPYAVWGGLFSTRATAIKAAGAIIDGYARDSADIERLGFPVFAQGFYGRALGVRGKVIDYRCPIEVGGVHIQPGDLVFGDREGVLIIPRDVEASVVEKAISKANAEAKVANALRNGTNARDAFAEFME